MIGRLLCDFAAEDQAGRNKERRRRFLAGDGALRGESEYLRKDGSVLRLFTKAIALRDDDGTLTEIVGVSKEASERLHDLAQLSHDMKTPLAAILGFADLLKHGYATDPAENRDLLERIEANAHKALRLALNVVDLSRTQDGRLRILPRACSLNDVVSHLVRHQEGLARIHGVGIDVRFAGDLPDVSVDEATFDRAIANLLDNAIKFSPRGSRVRVETARAGETVLVRVIDEGPGVPPERRASLFRRTDRAFVAERGGSGLGLLVVKAVVEAHHGTIVADFPETGGSVFEIRLPSAVPAAE
jgi:two-component system sensor histidine kinase KdpD